jgi:hypothetical protein
MFGGKSIPVWLGIIAVSGLFLMGANPNGCAPTAPVAKSGQNTSYATGDDGDLRMGVAWPVPRFTDNANGTVTDNLTGLIWTQNANCDGLNIWSDTIDYCNSLADGACGLNDGSIPGDWRLPNVREFLSLFDYGNYNPAIPSGHPFSDVQFGTDANYWTSTTDARLDFIGWVVDPHTGAAYTLDKGSSEYVWCVQGN